MSAPTPRPERETRDTPRYVVTDLGRRALAMDWLFGPKPTVAQIMARDAQRQQTDGAA